MTIMIQKKIFAQIHVPGLPDALGGGKNISTNFGLTSAGNIIRGLINASLIIATLGALIYLVVGGLQWITGGGDKTQLENARNKITSAIIGLIIVASAWATWILVGNFLGINVQELPFPTISGN